MDSAIGVHINVVFIWQRSRMFAGNSTPISRAIQQQKHGRFDFVNIDAKQ